MQSYGYFNRASALLWSICYMVVGDIVTHFLCYVCHVRLPGIARFVRGRTAGRLLNRLILAFDPITFYRDLGSAFPTLDYETVVDDTRSIE